MWFQLRSPELAEDLERLMAEDRDIVRGALDTVSDWRRTRPADVRAGHRSSRLRADRGDRRSGISSPCGKVRCSMYLGISVLLAKPGSNMPPPKPGSNMPPHYERT
jgi:hypothetical protein